MSHSTGYLKKKVDLLKRLSTFIKERFEPISHALMIFVFWLAHLLFSQVQISFLYAFIIFVGTIAFFLNLRFYDEIKDYETDKIINPNRPLARGLLSIDEVKDLSVISQIFIFCSFSYISFKASSIIAMTLLYGIFMYYEFFIPKLIRPHLTTYATSHTVVTVFLSLSLFCAFRDEYPWQLEIKDFSFALMSWLLFNIFELGRKTYQLSEERDGVETYSKIWTRPGAFVLVFLQMLLAIKLAEFHQAVRPFAWAITLLLAFSGLWFILDKRVISAKTYRMMTSLVIVLIYLAIIISKLLLVDPQR